MENNNCNFKGEPYFNIDSNSFNLFLELAMKIEKNLQTNEFSIPVESLLIGKRIRPSVRNFLRSRWLSNNLNEFKGLYAFGEIQNGYCKPVYIGITQSMIRRFIGHTIMKENQHATFAYLMVKHEESIHHNGKYNKLFKVNKDLIYDKIKIKQENIRKLRFTFHPMADNTEMHIAEAICASYLKAFWNSFETH